MTETDHTANLVIVTGLSPQIITVALYALLRAGELNYRTLCLHIITTEEGLKCFNNSFKRKAQPLQDFCNDYPNTPNIICHDHQINVYQDQHTEQDDLLQDADQLCAYLEKLTHSPAERLLLCLSGGRRSQSVMASHIFSLLSRPNDLLFHVTVPQHLQSRDDFLYPKPDQRELLDPDITFLRLPILKMRDSLPESRGRLTLPYKQLVNHAQKLQSEPKIRIDNNPIKIYCSDTLIPFSKRDIAFYLWFIHHLHDGKSSLAPNNTNAAEDYLRYCQKVYPNDDPRLDAVVQALKNGMTKEYFLQRRSALNLVLKKHLGPSLSRFYKIQSHGKNNDKSYSLHIDQGMIDFAQ